MKMNYKKLLLKKKQSKMILFKKIGLKRKKTTPKIKIISIKMKLL